MAGGRKDDQGKLRFDLLPVRPLESVASIYTYGAGKYDDNNWRDGIQWGRVFGATMRHLWAFWRGEDLDDESGLPHLAHAAFGCLTLLEFMETHRELDDRAMSKLKPPYTRGPWSFETPSYSPVIIDSDDTRTDG